MEDKLNKLKINHLLLKSCPGCESWYIGKNKLTLFKSTKEHVTRTDSEIKGCLDNYSNVEHLFSINNLILNDVNTHKFRLNLVCQNTIIIDQSNDCNMVLKCLGKCSSFECLLTIVYIQIMFELFPFILTCF